MASPISRPTGLDYLTITLTLLQCSNPVNRGSQHCHLPHGFCGCRLSSTVDLSPLDDTFAIYLAHPEDGFLHPSGKQLETVGLSTSTYSMCSLFVSVISAWRKQKSPHRTLVAHNSAMGNVRVIAICSRQRSLVQGFMPLRTRNERHSVSIIGIELQLYGQLSPSWMHAPSACL